MARVDAVIVGGGIVGLASALALLERKPSASLVVLEKEPHVAAHQTGHNSGVIHSGLYYKPGSLKAATCLRGRQRLEHYCEAHGIPFERCGKLVVATQKEEIPRLDELERRGRANGLSGVTRLTGEALREHEPHAAGVDALFVPETGIVDYARVAASFAREIELRGGRVLTSARVGGVVRQSSGVVVVSTAGDFHARVLVGCAGLGSDRLARRAGLAVDVAIVPFRGEYWMLRPERASLVRNLIYPVPDPAFPFLGVHFTRRIGGGVEAGPNAVLALAREGYLRASFDAHDALSVAMWPGFWKMVRSHWRAGMHELVRSLSRTAFARACSALVPEITPDDLAPGGAGVRAQAVGRNGSLVDDFAFAEGEHMVHVLNAPSPAATACLAIGELVAERASRWL